MLEDVKENAFLSRLARGLPRSPLQSNQLHGCDCEILKFPGREDTVFAATIDTIAEEIRMGLYDDPWLIGWMTVMANMSDLAAAGATPIGILISEVFPPGYPEDSVRCLQEGIRAATEACGTFVLGGDTNTGSPLITSGCAIGYFPEGRHLARTQCQPGEMLYSSGSLGDGNAFAFSKFSRGRLAIHPYRPWARIAEGRLLTHFASCCMDTSDGALSTLDQLARLNQCGFLLESSWRSALSEDVLRMANRAGVPEWLFLAGVHGEFELIFTIPENREAKFQEAAIQTGWSPLRLGRVIPQEEIRLTDGDHALSLDTAAIRNLGASGECTVEEYLSGLIEFGKRQGESQRFESDKGGRQREERRP
jgi:thiamine-monophosphate kinase